jgi:hypothetical protein
MAPTPQEDAKTLAHIVLHLNQLERDFLSGALAAPEALFMLGRLYERARRGPLKSSQSLLGDQWWDPINEELISDTVENLDKLVPLDKHFYDKIETLKRNCGWNLDAKS